jgi:hypothetical protein
VVAWKQRDRRSGVPVLVAAAIAVFWSPALAALLFAIGAVLQIIWTIRHDFGDWTERKP